MDVGMATEVGRQRRRNEDRFATYVPPPGEHSDLSGVLLVADGMGGERGGAEASQLAVDRLLEELTAGTLRSRPEYKSHADLSGVIRGVIRDASDDILRLGEADLSLSGLGSTLVATVFSGDRALIAHVGDSRCYRVREGGIERLTSDHTWVAAQVDAGVITTDEARQHPQRNVLTRALGDTESPAVDVRVEHVEHEDLFILCSDGLTNALADSEILQIARRFPRPQDMAEALAATANEKDGSDNVTVIACRCLDIRCLEAEGDPDDTEPIVRPVGFEEPRSRWRGWWLVAAVVALLAAAYFLPRLYAARAFARGVEAARQGHYLHSREELVTAIRWGLDKESAEQLVDLLLEFPSAERPEAEPAPPAPDAAPPSGN